MITSQAYTPRPGCHVADGRTSNFDPCSGKCAEEVAELADREQRTAEYQAERSADVTRQSQQSVRRLSLNV